MVTIINCRKCGREMNWYPNGNDICSYCQKGYTTDFYSHSRFFGGW